MLLANAPISSSSDSNLELILISAGVVLVVGILAFIPIRLVRSRGRIPDAMLAIAILWGLLLAGSICFSIMRQMDWTAAYNQRVDSGYGNPDDKSDKPKPPTLLWAGLGIVYVGMIGWAGRPAIKSA